MCPYLTQERQLSLKDVREVARKLGLKVQVRRDELVVRTKDGRKFSRERELLAASPEHVQESLSFGNKHAK